MNRVIATALYMVLIAMPGAFAQATPVAGQAANASQAPGAAEPDAGSIAPHSRATRHSGAPIHLGSNVTRQEMECLLSGVCAEGEKARVGG